MPARTSPALLCLSHLRWDFVYQRPNHLMARAARTRPVFFVEEPMIGAGPPRMDVQKHDGVSVARPHLPDGLARAESDRQLEQLVLDLVEREGLESPWLWYYTPMALAWTRSISASGVIYDCMDQLSGFRGAPVELLGLEQELFARADVVFTGGRSLYEAKAGKHHDVHAVPSAVDVAHFARARRPGLEPADQAGIRRPRIGYYGVIDERLDRELILEAARLRPDWQFILVGPVVKLAPHEVPMASNIHHLGMKSYDELPDYLRGWDVAMMPFARNEATRFISPTKTPEYLAGGRPVVSTPIHDVVEPYGRLGLVRIADTADAFVQATEAALHDDVNALIERADVHLAEMSWDASWARMDGLVRAAVARRATAPVAAEPVPRRIPVPALRPLPVGSSSRQPAAVHVSALGGRASVARAARTDDELASVR